MSHIAFTYHLIFSTYRRAMVIDEAHEKELYKFMYDFSMQRKVLIRRIGGIPNHVHILCDIPPSIKVADFVKLLKAESSKFLRANSHFPYWEKWSRKYGGFTVDASLREVRRQYIIHQKEHHHRLGFVEEYRQLLQEAGFSDNTPILGDDVLEE